MKDIFRSAAMAFAMFSSIPMPALDWKKENMRYMLCCLPLVGLFIGAVLCLWNFFCVVLDIGNTLFAVGLTLIPLALSGGIHMDGFCDTVDAVSSHAEPERKRQILKDSHAGAFAIIFYGAYLLAYFGFASEVGSAWTAVVGVGIIHALARATGALASTLLPSSGHGGLLFTFTDASHKRASLILLVWVIVCAAGLIALAPLGGVIAAAAAALCFLYISSMSRKEFGGMSGDLAGFIITFGELAMLAGWVIGAKVVEVCF